MGRLWSLLFLLVPILGVGVFVAAASTNSWPLYDHWFPEDISEHGVVIDQLFYSILWLTGLIFVGTGWFLFWFMWKYDAARNTAPVKYMHGSHTLEVVWSILPAATLLFIAFYQMNAWADAKVLRPLLSIGADRMAGTADDIQQPPLAEVRGRQFEWRVQYAGEDGQLGTPDDVRTVNDLHVPEGEEVVLRITSEDVLHSFFLPNVRLKNDMIPGMRQYVWFKAKKVGQYDIVCAELCGWGHYKMKGRLTVEKPAQFRQWLAAKKAEQNWPNSPADLEVESDE